MSTKSKTSNHRNSDVGVQHNVEKATVKAGAKRRQTIADITIKENTTIIASASKRFAIEPTPRRSSTSSPFKHHHAPVALGTAASHYFKGLPQTPVQKMIRSEQQKLLLHASIHPHEENTESILANQSYLSSSSSSGGRGSIRDETEVLNTSVLSDTTELTASNFLVLAATHRTTAENLKKIAEEWRQPLSTISSISSKEELVVTSAHGVKRRQSLSEGNTINPPNEEKTAVPRRRETLATVPIPRSASSPLDIPAMVPKVLRERNKVADYQRRLSDSNFKGSGKSSVTTGRRSSVAPYRDIDGTTELSISNSDMKTLLSKSISGNATSDKKELTLTSENELEMANKFASPGRDTRTSVVPVFSGKGVSKKSPSSKIFLDMETNAFSPARNTRSAAKKAATNSIVFEKEVAWFQSPSKTSRRNIREKSPQSNPSILTLENRMHLSPAKSTRSATKKLDELLVDHTTSQADLSLTIDSTKNESELYNSVEPYLSSGDGNTTASLGDLLDNLIHEDESRLDTSVTPTARNTRSAQKERTQSFATAGDAFASSPAHEALSKKGTSSHGQDDTAQLLLQLAAGNFLSVTNEQIDNAATKSDDDKLNDLVVQYSTNKSFKHSSVSPARNVDTSQESTISLNDLLSGYMPKGKSDTSGDDVFDEEKSSASSLFVRSAVSKASTLDTPHGMTDHDPFRGLDASSAPNSPPSTIRFSVADDSFFGATAIVAQSALRKALTPSRLTASPRRFIHSSSQHRSPFKSSLTPGRFSNPMSITGKQSPYRTSLTPSMLQASSLRQKRSLDNTKPELIETTSALKRQKTFDKLQDLAKESAVTSEPDPPASTSRNVNLLSALRRRGQDIVPSVMKRVAFINSPTFAEFNKHSPAENVTPMIIRRPKYSDKMLDDTAEIEIDMQSLMDSNQNYVKEAGHTPGATRGFKLMDSIDDSNMSVDSYTIPIIANEPTMALESGIFALLQGEPSVEDSYLQGIQCTEENTVELETDINALLHVPASTNDEPIRIGRRSLIFDDEPTVELESDINLLLPDVIIGDTTKQPPIESRRFSIAPSRRLSVSLDGFFDHTKPDDSAVVALSRNDETSIIEAPTKAIFDLKVYEIVDFSMIMKNFVQPNEKDFLIDVEHSMRENGISDTMVAFMAQVLQMIESQTEPSIAPSSVLEISNDETSLYFALQSYFRSGSKEETFEMSTLASSLHSFDIFEWMLWLVSATEQLGRPLDEKSIELADEIDRLDKLCIDTEKNLSLIANKSVQQVRKKSTNQRIVSIVHFVEFEKYDLLATNTFFSLKLHHLKMILLARKLKLCVCRKTSR